MKIAIDARELSTSTGRYVERLLYYLQKIDTDHDYIVLLKPQDLAVWQPKNPRFRAEATPYKEFTFSEQLGFKRQLNKLNPDLVHFPMVQQPVFYHGKVVTTMQDLTTIRFRNPTKNVVVFTFKQQVYKWVNKRVAKKSVAIITPSAFVKNDIVNYTGISPEKVTITHLAVDEFDGQEKPINGFTNRPFIMFTGRPQPHKNLQRLIKAFALLKDRHPDLLLMIAGKKDASHLTYERLAVQLGISDRVILTDWITDGQLKWAMKHTEAFIWPSLSEGFGLPPLEAMLYDAPVVSSNLSCIPEVLGKAAYYFDPLDETDMANAIATVLRDSKLRERLITAGHHRVKQYSWQRMAEQTLTIYKSALKQD